MAIEEAKPMISRFGALRGLIDSRMNRFIKQGASSRLAQYL